MPSLILESIIKRSSFDGMRKIIRLNPKRLQRKIRNGLTNLKLSRCNSGNPHRNPVR